MITTFWDVRLCSLGDIGELVGLLFRMDSDLPWKENVNVNSENWGDFASSLLSLPMVPLSFTT